MMASSCEPIFKVTIGIFGGGGPREFSSAQSRFSSLEGLGELTHSTSVVDWGRRAPRNRPSKGGYVSSILHISTKSGVGIQNCRNCVYARQFYAAVVNLLVNFDQFQ